MKNFEIYFMYSERKHEILEEIPQHEIPKHISKKKNEIPKHEIYLGLVVVEIYLCILKGNMK